MQRWCNKLRSVPLLYKTTPLSLSSHRLLHSFPSQIPSKSPLFFNGGTNPNRPFLSPPHPLSFIQLRHLTKKEMKEKMLKYKPRTPITSKLKKYKIKCYSSYKGRFRLMKDGQIRRWKEGKRHNAHLKSKAAKRRGRRPGVVPVAYAKVMKKLNFCG